MGTPQGENGSYPEHGLAGLTGDIAALWRHRVIIVALTLAAMVATAAYAMSVADKYEARADVLVTPIVGGTALSEYLAGLSLLRGPAGGVFTAGRLIEQPQIVDAVRQRMKLDYSRKQLRALVKVTPIEQSGIVSITAEAPQARLAADIANAFADSVIESRTVVFQDELRAEVLRAEKDVVEAAARGPAEVAEQTDRLAALRSLIGSRDPTLSVWTRAVPPDDGQSFPTVLVVFAALSGMLIGVGVALVSERLDSRVRRDEPLLARFPVLGRIPRIRSSVVDRYLNGSRDRLPEDAWEAYRMLRMNLPWLDGESGLPRTIVVTSGGQADGKTLAAVNLAVVVAATGARVVLVDGNLREPAIARVVSQPAESDGLTALVTRREEQSSSPSEPDGRARVRLLAPGPNSKSLVDWLTPKVLTRLRHQLTSEADLVIVDTSAVTEGADALGWISIADLVLVAVREGHSRRGDVEAAVRLLSDKRVQFGFVLTESRASRGALASRPMYHPPDGTTPPPLLEDSSRTTPTYG